MIVGAISMFLGGLDNTGFALFALGAGPASSYPVTSEKFVYSSGANSMGTNFGAGRWRPAAAGNKTVGIHAFGMNAGTYYATSDKYTYSTDGRVAGTTFSTARISETAVGNLTRGLFCGGWTSGTTPTTSTEKYTYSGDSVVGGTALPTAIGGTPGGASNATYGIIAFGRLSSGSDTNATQKYTYSGDTTAAATSFSTSAREFIGGSFSNKTSGYYLGGWIAAAQSTVDKYAWAGETVSSTTSLITARYFSAATSNNLTGIVSGGSGGLSSTETWSLAADTRVTGNNLSASRDSHSASSSNPGSI